MDNYVAVVFDTESHASAGLHELWRLDDVGEITVHGTAVIRRNLTGHIEVATKNTDPGRRTAIGVGIGALIGLIAGPAGAAVAIGAASGGIAGLVTDGG